MNTNIYFTQGQFDDISNLIGAHDDWVISDHKIEIFNSSLDVSDLQYLINNYFPSLELYIVDQLQNSVNVYRLNLGNYAAVSIHENAVISSGDLRLINNVNVLDEIKEILEHNAISLNFFTDSFMDELSNLSI